MPDLEEKIAEWRRRMAAGGINTPAVLDELESHLREDMEQQMRAGMTPERAFETAAQRIGKGELLKPEFAKVTGFKEARLGKLIGIACCFIAFAFSLLAAPRILTIPEMSFGQRALGLLAIALTWFCVVGCRFNYKYLPFIRNRRTRMAAGIGFGLAGIVWLYLFGGLLLFVIVPRILGSSVSVGFAPVFAIGISLLWAMALTAALGSIAYGLEEAARRRNQEDIYV